MIIRLVLISAIIIGLAAIAPILLPWLIVLLPRDFKSPEYYEFISSVSVTLGSLSGILFILLAFLQQQKEFKNSELEREGKKSQIIIERYIDSYLKTKSRILYRGIDGDGAIDDFYDNLKKFILRNPTLSSDKEKFTLQLKKGVNGSTFAKEGSLLLYKKCFERIIHQLVTLKASDMIPFFEAEMSEKEKCMAFYLWTFFFPRNENFLKLVDKGFLAEIEENLLIDKKHLVWAKQL